MIWLMQSYSESKSIPTFKLHRVIITILGCNVKFFLGFISFFFLGVWYETCRAAFESLGREGGKTKRERETKGTKEREMRPTATTHKLMNWDVDRNVVEPAGRPRS